MRKGAKLNNNCRDEPWLRRVSPTSHLDGSFLENDFHSCARLLRVGESSLALLFHAQENLVIVFRVVVSHGKLFHPSHFSDLHGLVKTAVPPSPVRS